MNPIRIRITAVMLCILMLFALTSCNTKEKLEQNRAVGDTFMGHVLGDDYASAYAMVSATVSDGDFSAYWEDIRATASGATSYDMEETEWDIRTADGLTSATVSYRVDLDNGRTALLRVVTREDIEGIAGIHFSDVTDFVASTASYLPIVKIMMQVFTVLALLFMVLMLVDCLRRKMKYKFLWAFLILCGIGVTVTVGDVHASEYFMGLMVEPSSASLDLGRLAVSFRLMIPLGSVLYLFLRKKFFAPAEPPASTQTEPAEEQNEV